MKQIRIALIVILGIFMIKPVNGQQNQTLCPTRTGLVTKWTIQIEPIMFDIYQNELMGYVYKHFETTLRIKQTENNPEIFTLNYGTTYEPIIPFIDRELSFLIGLHYNTKSVWGLGFHGWWFISSSRKHGYIETPQPHRNKDGSYTEYTYGAEMWDHAILHLINAKVSGAQLPIDYLSKNLIGVWTGNIYVSRKLTNIFQATFGLKFANIISQHIVAQLHRGPYFASQSWRYSAALSQNSFMDYYTAGPSFGLKLQTKHFHCNINQAILLGPILHNGTWSDARGTVTKGIFPFKWKGTTMTPATELNLKLMIQENITDKTTVLCGVGVFVSTFWNLHRPTKPLLPTDWEWGQGPIKWDIQKKNITLIGLSMNFGVEF